MIISLLGYLPGVAIYTAWAHGFDRITGLSWYFPKARSDRKPMSDIDFDHNSERFP